MVSDSSTRTRLIETTAELLHTQGYQATGINQILHESSAAKGALYHHFPGGKEELAAHALAASGASIAQIIEQTLASTNSLDEALRKLFQVFAEQLQTSQYQKGCPIATTALEEGASSEHIQRASRDVFRSWQAHSERKLLKHGWEPAQAAKMARFIVAVFEGGLLLSRVERSTEPLEQTVEILSSLLTQQEKLYQGEQTHVSEKESLPHE